MPAQSGQSQTGKASVSGAENKCFLASCRAERERERAREREPATSCLGAICCEVSFLKSCQNTVRSVTIELILVHFNSKTRCTSFEFFLILLIFLEYFENKVKFVRMSIHTEKLNLSTLLVDL